MIISDVLDRIDALSSKEQAICLFEAAKAALPIWAEYENSHGFPPRGAELLSAFQSWLGGNVSSMELKQTEGNLCELLPENLTEEHNPSYGFAGWSVCDVAIIALEEAGEVQESIFRTGLRYAAGAVCDTGHRGIHIGFDDLSKEETQFIWEWWQRCCELFPRLNAAV